MPTAKPSPTTAADPRHGAFRLATGGQIDRSRVINFSWDGRPLTACAGDTLAAALLAHGESLVGRGFKFHRPRGILSAGAEEPNALVTIGDGARLDPIARATLVRVHDGLAARPQNCWPSLRFDVGRMLDFVAPLWPAGFYNKTFIWPSWHVYEDIIRRTAGLGEAPTEADPDRYDVANASGDLLVIGGGATGLAAAQLAARAGASVILVEQDAEFGGRLLLETCTIGGVPALQWLRDTLAELQANPRVRLLPATTAFGLYDHGHAGLLERAVDRDPTSRVRHRYWRVRARALLLATGAIEQPWVFERNDLPGVMLAGAIRTYAQRYAVVAGRRVVFATNNDSAYLAALDLARAGVRVQAVVDSRTEAPSEIALALRAAGVPVHCGAVIVSASGGKRVSAVEIMALNAGNDRFHLECDAVGMSAGWAPAVHLWSHARGRLAFDDERQCFLPVAGTAPLAVAGALAGAHTLAECFASAAHAVAAAAARAGFADEFPTVHPEVSETPTSPRVGKHRVAPVGRRHRQWLDFQHDVTMADVDLAIREGFDAIEHLKRYTTTGMSVDQGKTSNLNALLEVAALTGREPDAVGTTTFRPPYTPVTLGALAGRQVGEFYAPRRQLPAHSEHLRLEAVFEEAAGWMRPAWYPRVGETGQQAVMREALSVRASVGIFDASPLGKIEIEGPDAARFLDAFYINNVLTLEIGRTRYGLMLNENGVIIDDGTIARLGATHFVITTTSGGASRIAAWLDDWRQCEWPDLDVVVTPVTTQWATVVLAGPKAREVLSRLESDVDLSPTAFPHLQVRTGRLAGVPTRLYRVSFSGELGYEINVPARFASALWRALEEAGRDYGITPYGTEALLLLRLEKGFMHVGLDTDGTSSPADVGWGEIALRKQADFIGKRSLIRPENRRADRLQLVGLSGDDELLIAGAHLRLDGTTEGSDGWITSAAFSPTLGKRIALGVLRGGRERIGQMVTLFDFGRTGRAEVAAVPFYDPQGARMHG
jgi:sarcosine oxidase subunit alpha